jgi:carbon storage regulator
MSCKELSLYHASEDGNLVLILTRKLDECITIGDDIEIRITELFSDRVRIGIIAPDNVAIHRKEVAVQIESQLNQDGPSKK